jgi:hypothetical protein
MQPGAAAPNLVKREYKSRGSQQPIFRVVYVVPGWFFAHLLGMLRWVERMSFYSSIALSIVQSRAGHNPINLKISNILRLGNQAAESVVTWEKDHLFESGESSQS